MDNDEILRYALAINENFQKNISLLQDDGLFKLRLAKSCRLRKIAEARPFANGWRVITEKKWADILGEVGLGRTKFHYIETNFFSGVTADTLAEILNFLRQSIVLVSNSAPQFGGLPTSITTLRTYQMVYDLSPETLFLGWDWDNHHHLCISSAFAAASDFYFPTHVANDYELTSFCAHKYHVPSGSHQWGRGFLLPSRSKATH